MDLVKQIKVTAAESPEKNRKKLSHFLLSSLISPFNEYFLQEQKMFFQK